MFNRIHTPDHVGTSCIMFDIYLEPLLKKPLAIINYISSRRFFAIFVCCSTKRVLELVNNDVRVGTSLTLAIQRQIATHNILCRMLRPACLALLCLGKKF